MVMLREITEDNRVAVEALAVTEEQSHYVAGVAWSLAEAAEHPDAKPWYRAVYATTSRRLRDDHRRITVDNPAYVGPYFLVGYSSTARFQGSGYGTATLDLRHRPRPHPT